MYDKQTVTRKHAFYGDTTAECKVFAGVLAIFPMRTGYELIHAISGVPVSGESYRTQKQAKQAIDQVLTAVPLTDWQKANPFDGRTREDADAIRTLLIVKEN